LTPKNSQTQVHQVASEIMEYLRENPSAKDSCRGIASCWVSEDFHLVERALFLLVGSGLVTRETRHGTAFYGLNSKPSGVSRTGGRQPRPKAGLLTQDERNDTTNAK